MIKARAKKSNDTFDLLASEARQKPTRQKSKRPRSVARSLKELKSSDFIPTEPETTSPADSAGDVDLRLENEALKERLACVEHELEEYQALNPTIEDVLDKTTASDLIVALVPKLLGALQTAAKTIQRIDSRLESIDQQLAKQKPPPGKKQTLVRKRIAVVGILNRQVADLQKQVGHLSCELRCVTSDEPFDADGFDHVIGWKNFINHTTSDRFKGDRRFVLVSGGIGKIVQKIHELAKATAL